MASLYNNKISATYVGLIKTLDSAVINATLRELSDGLGNQTGLFINTSGDFKATGILEFGSLKDTGENITITKFVDEADGIANNDNDTTIPTSAAIIDYVASQVTLEDLDFSGDSGSGSVDLDSQTFAIVGTANEIETSASGQQLQIGLPTNVTISGEATVGSLKTSGVYYFNGNSISHLSNSNLVIGFKSTTGFRVSFDAGSTDELLVESGSITGAVILDEDNMASNSATKLATQQSIKAYVDSQVTAQDLDFGGDSGTGSVDLDSQSLSITGTTNQVTTSATNQTLNISLPSTVHRNLQGNVIGNVTGNVTGNITGVGTLSDGSTAVTQSQGDNSTKIATTAYVDAGLSDQDTLAEVLAVGNTTGGTDIAVSAGDDITFADNSSAYFGNANDFQIYHDSTSNNSFIKETGVGSLQIWCKDFEVYNAGGTETLINADVNAGVQLYYDNLVKLATVSNGVDITGNADVSGEISVGADNTLLANTALRFKASGDAYIDHNNVGSSLYIRTSNAASLDTNAVIIASDGDIDLSGSLTIAQDLTVNGTTTTVNTQTLAVEDPLISLAKDNAANSVDIGFYGRYNDGSNRYLGLYADASDTNTFKLFKGTTTEPTTTVDSTATGYTLADLDVNNLDASTITTGYQFIGDYIYHTGDNNTYLGFPSNDNFAVSTGGNTNLAISSSTVTLKHSGSTKLETVAGGINVTGNGTFTGQVLCDTNTTSPSTGDAAFYKSSAGAVLSGYQVILETGGAGARTSGLTIDSNQSATFINDINLDNSSPEIYFLTDATHYNWMVAAQENVDGGFEITPSNAVGTGGTFDTPAFKLDASTRNATFAGDVLLDSDSTKLKLGDDQDLQLYHDGANSYIETTTTSAGDLYIKALGSGHDLYLRATDDIFIQPQGGNNGIKVIGQGAVELYHNNSKKFETTSTGTTVTGNLIVNGSSGDTVTISKTTTEPSIRIEGDANKDFCVAISGELLTITQNDGTTDILTLDHDTKNATFGGDITSNGLANFDGRVKVSGSNTDQYYYEGARDGVGVTYRNYDNSNNIYHDSYASQVIRVNQLGGSGGGFYFSGGDFNLTTTNVHINGGTSYNDKSNIYLSNGRTLIQSDIVNATANGDTSLDFQTRKNGSLGSAMFINEFRNIGIGTTSISSTDGRLKLSAPSGVSNPAGISLYGNNSNAYGGSNVVRSKIQSTTDGTAFGAIMKFYTNDTSNVEQQRMIINSDGNIGINNTVASAKLQIHNTNGGAGAVAAFLVNASTSQDTETILAFAAHTNDDIATNRYSYISTVNTSGSNGQDMKFATNETGSSATEKLRIKSNGAITLGTIKPIGHSATNGTINNGSSTTYNANTAGGNQAAGFLVISAVPNSASAGGSVEIWTHIHTQGANVYSLLSSREENNITISESGGVFTISNSSGSVVHYNVKTINMTDFDSTINGY